MNSSENRPSEQMMRMAEEQADLILSELKKENEENKRKQKKSLIKLTSMLILLAVLIAFSTIAWFTMNREVKSDSLAMTSTEMPFDIATKGAKVRSKELLSSEVRDSLISGYNDGTSSTLQDESGNSGNYNVGESLLIRYDTGESEIGPGGCGELSLYVIPKTNDTVNVKVTLNVVAFAEIEKQNNGATVYKDVTDSNGNLIPDTEIIEITGTAASLASVINRKTGNSTAAADAADYLEAANYIKGHIMFFGENGDTSSNTAEASRYYYKTPYTSRIITKSITDKKDKAVQIPILWMWPNTLGQIALPDNVSRQRNGYPILKDDDSSGKLDVNSYLKSEKTNIFDDVSGNGITDSAIDVLCSGYQKTYFDSMSTGYNQADFKIGTNVAYFMIEVLVENDG